MKYLDKISLSRIIYLGLFLRISSILLLPNQPLSVSLDELTYSKLTFWVSNDLDVKSFPGFGSALYNTSRTFIIPAVIINHWIDNELAAIRIVSCIYGIASIFVFASLTNRIINYFKIEYKLQYRLKKIYVITFILFPSHFLWTILGLRESASEFFVLSILLILLKILESTRNNLHTFVLYAIFMLFIILSFGARRETALVFSISLLFGVFFVRPKIKSILLIFSIFLAILLSQFYSSNVTSRGSSITDKTHEIEILLSNENLTNTVSRIWKLEEYSNKNRINANSALPINNCFELSQSPFSRVLCNFGSIPTRTFSFIARPLPIIDSGSKFFVLASFENLIWLGLFLTTIITFNRTKSQNLKCIYFSAVSFVILFCIAAGLYEGNLGTAFRHKSILLPLLLLISFKSIIQRISKHSL